MEPEYNKLHAWKNPQTLDWFRWLLSLTALILIIMIFISTRRQNLPGNRKSFQTSPTSQGQAVSRESKKVRFTSRIFEPTKVNSIIPLGELNGGYIESQTINGITINIKTDAQRNAEPIEVYAPVDMTLEDYSYFADGTNAPQWHLGFRISESVKLSFDHISEATEIIKSVTPPTVNSAYVSPTRRLAFRAGDLVAKTSGTNEAHNWNIYLRDESKTNTFVNQERYDKLKDRYSFVNAACPFDYYEENIRQEFLALMGHYKAGESKNCGSNSRDVKGSIAGMWHLTQDGVQEAYDGQYASPFSIYKTSANELILYEINRKRYIIGEKNQTYKDPALVTDSHCYNLTQYGHEVSTNGYAYFKVLSDTKMQLSYKSTGACPATFPENSTMIYYR